MHLRLSSCNTKRQKRDNSHAWRQHECDANKFAKNLNKYKNWKIDRSIALSQSHYHPWLHRKRSSPIGVVETSTEWTDTRSFSLTLIDACFRRTGHFTYKNTFDLVLATFTITLSCTVIMTPADTTHCTSSHDSSRFTEENEPRCRRRFRGCHFEIWKWRSTREETNPSKVKIKNIKKWKLHRTLPTRESQERTRHAAARRWTMNTKMKNLSSELYGNLGVDRYILTPLSRTYWLICHRKEKIEAERKPQGSGAYTIDTHAHFESLCNLQTACVYMECPCGSRTSETGDTHTCITSFTCKHTRFNGTSLMTCLQRISRVNCARWLQVKKWLGFPSSYIFFLLCLYAFRSTSCSRRSLWTYNLNAWRFRTRTQIGRAIVPFNNRIFVLAINGYGIFTKCTPVHHFYLLLLKSIESVLHSSIEGEMGSATWQNTRTRNTDNLHVHSPRAWV